MCLKVIWCNPVSGGIKHVVVFIYFFVMPIVNLSLCFFRDVYHFPQRIQSWSVQNRTNPIEKPQTEPTQTETAKNRIWFGCIWITFLLNLMVWFGLVCGFHFSNRIKPNQTAT